MIKTSIETPFKWAPSWLRRILAEIRTTSKLKKLGWKQTNKEINNREIIITYERMI
jgi:hypothetical protein